MFILFLAFHPVGWVCMALIMWLADWLADPID
jgi:hypothetical protein